MPVKLRVAVIGVALNHITALYRAFAAHSDQCEFVGCADVPPYPYDSAAGRSARFAESLRADPMPPVFEDWHALADEQPDIALVCPDKQAQTDTAVELLSRGIAVILEKPMAITFDDAMTLARAAWTAQTPLIVNWPSAWVPAFRTAKALVDAGAVGRPLRFAYRSPATLGPYSYGQNLSPAQMNQTWWYSREKGGGALLDYGGYGCVLASWILGTPPRQAFAYRQNFRAPFAEVEDYAAMELLFDGTLARLEGSWATVSGGGIPTGPVVYGEKGTLVTDRYAKEVKIYTTLRGVEPDLVVPAEPIAEDLATQAIAHLREGTPLHPLLGLDLNLKAQGALDAALRSAQSGKLEAVFRPDTYFEHG